MPVPVVGHANQIVARVAQLQAPDAIDLDGCDIKLGFDAAALQVLKKGDAVEDEGAGQVDRVDAAPFAGTVDAGRARAEGVGHAAQVSGFL